MLSNQRTESVTQWFGIVYHNWWTINDVCHLGFESKCYVDDAWIHLTCSVFVWFVFMCAPAGYTSSTLSRWKNASPVIDIVGWRHFSTFSSFCGGEHQHIACLRQKLWLLDVVTMDAKGEPGFSKFFLFPPFGFSMQVETIQPSAACCCHFLKAASTVISWYLPELSLLHLHQNGLQAQVGKSRSNLHFHINRPSSNPDQTTVLSRTRRPSGRETHLALEISS